MLETKIKEMEKQLELLIKESDYIGGQEKAKEIDEAIEVLIKKDK